MRIDREVRFVMQCVSVTITIMNCCTSRR